jgi:hypothetical protein
MMKSMHKQPRKIAVFIAAVITQMGQAAEEKALPPPPHRLDSGISQAFLDVASSWDLPHPNSSEYLRKTSYWQLYLAVHPEIDQNSTGLCWPPKITTLDVENGVIQWYGYSSWKLIDQIRRDGGLVPGRWENFTATRGASEIAKSAGELIFDMSKFGIRARGWVAGVGLPPPHRNDCVAYLTSFKYFLDKGCLEPGVLDLRSLVDVKEPRDLVAHMPVEHANPESADAVFEAYTKLGAILSDDRSREKVSRGKELHPAVSTVVKTFPRLLPASICFLARAVMEPGTSPATWLAQLYLAADPLSVDRARAVHQETLKLIRQRGAKD